MKQSRNWFLFTFCKAIIKSILHPADLPYIVDCSFNRNLCFVQVEKALQKVHLTGAKVERIKEVFRSEMEHGIHEQPSSLQMENTYIPELPNGTGN
jgi:hypothetical protein